MAKAASRSTTPKTNPDAELLTMIERHGDSRGRCLNSADPPCLCRTGACSDGVIVPEVNGRTSITVAFFV